MDKEFEKDHEDHFDFSRMTLDKLNKCKKLREECEQQFEENYIKTWIVLGVFMLLGAIAGKYIPKTINSLTHAKYDRSGLDAIMTDYFGDKTMTDILTDELLITSYEYNYEQPRFYSKYFTEQEPGIYDVTIGNATGASSSAPTYFNPKTLVTPYGLNETLIDGGLICNNPSLYAYTIARFLRGNQKIRILSLGTGEKEFKDVVDQDSKFDIFW